MEVKLRYKQTEVGGTPKEWEVKRMGDVATFYKGKGLPKSALSESGAEPCIHYGELFTRYPETIREIFSRTDASEAVFRSVANDVLMPTSDVTPRGLAKASCVIVDGVILGGDILVIRSDTNRVHGPFLSLVIRYEETQVLQLVTGSTVYHLYGSDMKNFTFSMPPLPEQTAIATALSDVDGLLGGLDRLIAKKRDLKQAAMQQLLTGQTRLPDFHGEWEVKRLGDVGSTYGGLTGKTKADFGEGPARYITFMNVMANVVIDCETFEPVQVSPTEAQNRAIKGDLFFNGSSETPEEVAMCSVLLDEVQGVYLNSFCFGFRFHHDAEADGLFLAYYLRSKEGRELMKSLAQGSTRYNLSKVALLKSPLRLPRLLEQTAIASVLTEMDAELAALTQRREKTRALKQAMMQELLTGRTRLV